MPPPQITFSIKGLTELTGQLNDGPAFLRAALNDSLRDLGRIAVPVLKLFTPRRGGKLAKSTVFQIVGGTILQSLEVRQGARTMEGIAYGGFVREGTRPHIIVATRAKALRFIPNGQPVFARSVQHPGNKPNRYHIRALNSMQVKLDQSVRRTAERVAKFLTGRGLGDISGGAL